ncbi:hypothetical protein CU110_13760 [Cobetia sp. ICG0124]|nr:hypothetical protein CU110_13760 [Cobetia sp. ICG0124]
MSRIAPGASLSLEEEELKQENLNFEKPARSLPKSGDGPNRRNDDPRDQIVESGHIATHRATR